MKTLAKTPPPATALTRPSLGFTLIELLVTISIAAILLAIAIPSFRDLLLNSRMTTQTNELVLALTSAKSEAIKRGIRAVVCSRATDATCAADGTTDWDNGWLVFVDNDNSGTVNGDDLILQVRAPLEGSNTLRFDDNRVSFESTGFSPGLTRTFNLCDSRGTENGRSIVVSAQGRVASQNEAGECP